MFSFTLWIGNHFMPPTTARAAARRVLELVLRRLEAQRGR